MIHSERYAEVLGSLAWKLLRAEVVTLRGNACQRCGIWGRDTLLELHHKHYDTLGRETPKDVELLCIRCHDKADAHRKARAERSVWASRVAGWAEARYGECCGEWLDMSEVAEEFSEWLERKAVEEY